MAAEVRPTSLVHSFYVSLPEVKLSARVAKKEKTLEENPEDWDTLSMIADHFHDVGDAGREACYRYMVEHKKRPYSGGGKWHWFNADTVPVGIGDPFSDIPGPPYLKMLGGDLKSNHKIYHTIYDAHMSFAQGWVDAVKDGFDLAAWLKTRATA